MSNKIQSDEQNKNVFRFHLFKLWGSSSSSFLFFFFFFFFNFFFFYNIDTSILIIEKKNKTRNKIGQIQTGQHTAQPTQEKG